MDNETKPIKSVCPVCGGTQPVDVDKLVWEWEVTPHDNREVWGLKVAYEVPYTCPGCGTEWQEWYQKTSDGENDYGDIEKVDELVVKKGDKKNVCPGTQECMWNKDFVVGTDCQKECKE